MKRGLFVELLGGIGDLIFALPALDALARSHPNLTWDVFTFAPGADLLRGDPRVGEVFGAPKGTPEGDDRPHCWHQLSALLARRSYAIIVTDTRHSGVHELVEASGAPLTVTQLWRGTGPEEPITQLFLRRLQEEGVIPPQLPASPARLVLSDAERRIARETWFELGLRPNATVVFNPHAGMTIKRWPAASFAALGQALRAKGWRVAVLTGEAPALAEKIAREAAASVFPRRPLRETAACLERIALLVSADSGLAHLANAVGTPVVGLYGPTWAGRYGVAAPARNLQSPFDCPERQPMNFTLQGCWYTGQCVFPDKSTCCADISVESVLAAADQLLSPSAEVTRRRQGAQKILVGDGPRATPRQRAVGLVR